MEWQQLLRKAEIERREKRRYPNEWEQKVSIGKSFRFLFFALPVCHLSDHEITCKFEELPKDSTQIFSQTRLLWYHFIRALTNENFATVLWLRFASWYGNENIFGNKMISSEFLLRFLNDEERLVRTRGSLQNCYLAGTIFSLSGYYYLKFWRILCLK